MRSGDVDVIVIIVDALDKLRSMTRCHVNLNSIINFVIGNANNLTGDNSRNYKKRQRIKSIIRPTRTTYFLFQFYNLFDILLIPKKSRGREWNNAFTMFWTYFLIAVVKLFLNVHKLLFQLFVINHWSYKQIFHFTKQNIFTYVLHLHVSFLSENIWLW